MGSDKTATHLRGLAIQDPRLTSVWTGQSANLEQADPRPGIPVASGDYDLVLGSGGEMSAGAAVQIYSSAGGSPGRAGGARMVWRNQGETNYRGKDPSSLITHWEAISWIDGSGTPSALSQPHAVTLADTTIVTAYRYMNGTIPSIAVRTRNKTSGSWGSATLVYTGTATAPCRWPGLVVLPDGKIMLYFWTEAASAANIRAYVSADDGATWSLVSTGLLASTISTAGTFGSGNAGYELGRIRGAYANGQILLLGELQTHDTSVASSAHFIQLASNSMGADFSQIEIASAATVFVAAPEVVAHNGEFLIYSLQASGVIKQSRLGSAYDSLSTSLGNSVVTGTAVSEGDFDFGILVSGGYYMTDQDLAACVDPEGRLYIVVTYWQNSGGTGATKQVTLYRSEDNGDTFSAVGTKGSLSSGGDGIWWESGDASTYPTGYTATACQGRLVVISGHAAAPGNEDSSLSAFYLGGWSSVTFPPRSDFRSQLDQGVWTRTWVPFDIPTDVGWSASGTASTEQIASDGTLSLASGSSRFYTLNPTSSETEGMIVRFSVNVTIGSPTGDVYGVILRLADGTNDRQINIRLGTNSFRVYDPNGTATLATVTDVDLDGSYIDFLVAISESNAQLWYRTSSAAGDRNWTNALNTTGLTNDTGSPDANNLIKWGALGAGTGKWTELHYAVGGDTGQQMSTTPANPGDLSGEVYGTVGHTTYIDGGLGVTATDGPAFPGDLYTVSTRYGYEVGRIFPASSPSPRSAWRSTTTGAQSIALQFDSAVGTVAESNLGNDSICVALLGVNFRLWELQGYDVGTTSWVSIGSVDNSDGMTGLNFTRNGSTVVPGAGTNLYLHLNELEGASISLNGILRKIKTNTAGRWDTATSSKRPTVFLEGVANSDPASASNGIIIPRNVAAVFNTNNATYSGYRISIASQTTVDGYFEIGNIVAGPMEFFGTQYSWGRTITTSPNVELTTRADGSVYSRKFGPAARAISFGWKEGVDTSQLYASTVSPDYLQASTSGGPVASVAEVPLVVDGLATMLGPDSPVVYLPAVPKGSASVITFNRRHEFLFGRISSEPQITNVVGDELSDPGEVFRVSNVTIQELV